MAPADGTEQCSAYHRMMDVRGASHLRTGGCVMYCKNKLSKYKLNLNNMMYNLKFNIYSIVFNLLANIFGGTNVMV